VNPKSIYHVYARAGACDALNKNWVHVGSLPPLISGWHAGRDALGARRPGLR
jgi:hypothetical protein